MFLIREEAPPAAAKASHPSNGWEVPGFMSFLLFREEAHGRGLEKDLAPPAHRMGGRYPVPRLPPVDRAGGSHFLKNFKSAPFFEFNFFNFFKKFPHRCTWRKGPPNPPRCQPEFFLKRG
jgi:hypothetical protein